MVPTWCLGNPPHGHPAHTHPVTSWLQTTSGYRVNVVTVRKLEFETDAFAFADKVRAGALGLGAWWSSKRWWRLLACQAEEEL